MRSMILVSLLSLVALMAMPGCGRGPDHAFNKWADAVQDGDIAAVVELERDLFNQTRDLSESEMDSYLADLATHWERPATTASLDKGFGIEPSLYSRKLFFPADARITIASQEERPPDGARLKVTVSYTEANAPVYVTNIQVVWHGPDDSPRGEEPARPTPAFSSGYFEANHPFLANPGYQGYELRLHSGVLKTATLTLDMARDPDHGWLVSGVTPLVAENVYWD